MSDTTRQPPRRRRLPLNRRPRRPRRAHAQPQEHRLSLPLGKLIIDTGVSGSGKSSLAFDTIYAEGQRRYVESLSAYARQFLERMEKPDVDRIDGISPAIAIRQKNSIRNPRSTVGTTTEIHDYMRLLFARVGRTFCRNCGREVVRETAEVVAAQLGEGAPGTRLLIGFDLPIVATDRRRRRTPADTDEVHEQIEDEPQGLRVHRVHKVRRGSVGPAVAAAIDVLKRKGFGRLLVDGRAVSFDDVEAAALADRPVLQVVVDRVQLDGDDLRQRLTDSIETAYREGGGAAWAIEWQSAVGSRQSSSRRQPTAPSRTDHCPRVLRALRVPAVRHRLRGSAAAAVLVQQPVRRLPDVPRLRQHHRARHGSGRARSAKSIQQGAIEPWSKPHYRAQLAELKRAAREAEVRLDVPWAELTDEEQRFVVEGGRRRRRWLSYDGIRGFFRWLERKKYKVHVRVFLSRYRGYLTCPDCGGARLRREARDVQVAGRTIDQVSALTVREAQEFFATLQLTEKEAAIAEKVLKEIRAGCRS